MNKELLLEMLNERLVSVQKHPDADLFIYNYTAKVQYDRLWNEVTIQSRGLILDADMNYVARPFGKFFNLEEHQPHEIPQLPFEVFEKLDGSLGILYWLNDKPFIATRGSFISEQARHATQILNEKYSHTFDKLDKNKTYLFEIIYPQNRIVVNYGTLDDLILITVIDNETGLDVGYDDIGFSLVKRHDGINDLQQLKQLTDNEKEGFVIRFKNGMRVKMKFAEYVRLHRIITGVSNVAVWEYLADGKSFEELLEKVPDEFYNWVKQTQSELQSKYDDIKTKSFNAYRECYSDDKKTFALSVLEKYKDLSPVIFSIYNKKDYNKIIWKLCRPAYSKPFKIEV